jgi:hypothetical protein
MPWCQSEKETFVPNFVWEGCTNALWSSGRSADGQYVAVSSQDGYCSLLAFSDAELGVQMPSNGTFQIESPPLPCSMCSLDLTSFWKVFYLVSNEPFLHIPLRIRSLHFSRWDKEESVYSASKGILFKCVKSLSHKSLGWVYNLNSAGVWFWC